MSNFALQIDIGGGVTFTNNAGLVAATKISGTVKVLGAFLKDQGNNALNPMFDIGDGATVNKLGMYCHHLFGGSGINFTSSAGPTWDSGRILDFSTIQGSLVNTDYYTINFSVDPAAATRASVSLIDVDGVTVLASNAANGNITADPLPTSAGCGIVHIPGARTGSQLGVTYDFLTMNEGATPRFNAQFNEGTGSTTADTVGGTTGTLTAPFTWITLPDVPDHGIVTLTPPSVLMGATALATIVWYDALNNPLSPQPPVSWRIGTDSSAATIDAAGNITPVAMGSATVKGLYSGVTATAELTVRPQISFTATIGVV